VQVLPEPDLAVPPRAERLLAGLDPAQRQAVCTNAQPLCILAGAGSGKTRVLTRRIAWRVVTGSAEARHVLALTFTRKAAAQLRRRLAQLGVGAEVTAGTFHSVALTQLRQRWADQGRQPPRLLASKAGMLARILKSSDPAKLLEVAAEIEWAKARLLGPGDYEEEVDRHKRRPPVPDMAAVFACYEQEKSVAGAVDFDDLLSDTVTAIDADPAFAATQRWRWRHLFVDEYQDVNPAQVRLLEAWLGDRTDLCVVGDPDQAIYSWNGADPSCLAEFPRRHPGATVVRLDDNYRSSPQVLAVARSVLPRRRRAGQALRPHREDGPVPEVSSYPSELAEAAAIARQLRLGGPPARPWGQMAVLARTNAQLVVLEQALARASVPCRVAGGGSFLRQRAVAEALRRLEEAGHRSFQAAVAHLEELASEAPEDEEGGDRSLLEALLRLAGEYRQADQLASVAGFRAWLVASLASVADETGGDAVDLATFHRAKGLEWEVVFLAGLEQGLVPIGHAAGAQAEAEERRLLYVAMTRARQELRLSWAERRSFGQRCLARQPSPYLDAVEEAARALSGDGRVPAGALESVRAQRRRLGVRRRPSPAARLEEAADPELLGSLRAWRSAAARAAAVPEFVIFHDATLAAVAASRPTTREELQRLPGIGPVKASRYGEEVLRLVLTNSPPGATTAG